MALAVPFPFSKFVVLIGDGATPTEVFEAPCAFQSRSLNRTKNLNEIVIPDCDDEDAAAWIDRDVVSMSWSITGDGMLDELSRPVWDFLFIDTESRNVKVVVTRSTGGTFTYAGKAHLTTWNESASRGEKVMFSVELQGDGPLTVTAPP